MPMSALLNIAVAEPSAIIRSGLEAVLKRIPGFRIQIIEIATAELLQETLRSHKPDILIINPSLPGYYTIQLLKEETGCTEMKCIALLYAVADHALLRPYLTSPQTAPRKPPDLPSSGRTKSRCSGRQPPNPD